MRRLRLTYQAVALLTSLGATTLSGCAAPRAPKAGIENPVVRLQRDVAKVDRAIDATKRLLALAHSAPYVPDLYMRLAELYAEQSRYQYLIAYENDKKRSRAIVSIPARILKQQAVQLYDRVTREFPDFQELDKALFFKGHELRELGDYDEMIATFERLVRDFPRSSFRHQALIVLGDHSFDKGNFPRAEDYYKRVLADAEGPQHAMARYKMAWSRQNQDDCKGALVFFEATARTGLGTGAGARSTDKPDRSEKTDKPDKVERTEKLDLRREALVDSGYCFTEVRKPDDAVTFYRGLSESRSVYLAALSRLARRYHSKGQFRPAALLYREVLEVDPAHEDALEFVPRLHEGLVKSPSPGTVDRDVDVVVRVAELRYFSPRTTDAIRKAMIHDFEVYARDLATKAQLQTREAADRESRSGSAAADLKLLTPVATAYERYLGFFRDVAHVPEAQAVEGNLADVLFAARRYSDAGRAYEAVGGNPAVPAEEQRAALFSATAAYAQALKGRLGNYEQVSARAGLYRAGREYIARFPGADNVPQIKFNIASALYNEGRFREAIARFVALVEQYPEAKEGTVSAQLALDSFRLLYDMEGLARTGQRFLAEGRLKDEAARRKIQELVVAAQQRQLDVLTMSAGQGERAAESLLSFAQRNAGSVIGEKALLNAFAAARDQGDMPQLTRIGDQLLRDYPKSTESVAVLGTLGKLTAQAAQFDEAARYLNEAARREQGGARGAEMQRTAVALQAQRGDRKAAEEGLRALAQGGAPAAILAEALQAVGELYRRSGDSAALQELARSQPALPAELRMDVLRAALLAGEPVERFAADLRALAGASGDTGAEARLLQADLVAGQAEAVVFTANRAEDAKLIGKRFALINQAEASYLAVLKLQRPRVMLMALGRLSQLYRSGARFLEGAPVPPALTGDNAKRYQEAFKAKAKPLMQKADDALRTCGDTAQQLRVLSPTARACLSGQAPPRFEPPPPAVAPRPTQPEAPALRARLLKDPGDGEALQQLALLHQKAGDSYGAKVAADRAVEVSGGGAAASAAHNLAGVFDYQLGEIDDAARHFQEAVKLDKRNQRARQNLATLYREFGQGKLASTELPGVPEGVPPDLLRDPAVITPATPPAPSGSGGAGAAAPEPAREDKR